MEPQPLTIDRKFTAITNDMTRWEVEELEKAILHRRLFLMVEQLKARGFQSTVRHLPGEADDTVNTQLFNMVLISPPAGAESEAGEWADLAQCRRLIDTRANLPPAEAFDRWAQGLALPDPYTKWDAERDRRAEIADARRRYQEGIDNAEDHRLAVRAAADYAGMAEPADRNEHLRTIPQLAEAWGVSIRRAQAHVKHLHTTLGVGTKMGNIWVLTEEEAAVHRPAEGPGRPRKSEEVAL